MSATNGHAVIEPVNRITAIPKQLRKISIVGKAGSKEFAPFDDPSWEIWGVGDMGLSVKRLDRSFEVHDIHDGFTRWATHYVEYLKAQHDFPIYVFDKHPDMQSAVQYPRHEVLNRFQVFDNEGKPVAYFTNSISWMIALAVYEGVQEIGLWGVDMAQHGVGLQSEYAHQRPSCELWVGIAAGAGIKVTIHQNSDLLKTPYQYGFDSEPHALRLKHKARDKDLATGKKKAAEKAAQFQDEIERLNGHLEYWQGRLSGVVGDFSLQANDPALSGLTDDQKKRIAEMLAGRAALHETEREKITDRIAQIGAGIKKLKAQQNEQVQRQLIHMGAQDDQQYWHQHHFQ